MAKASMSIEALGEAAKNEAPAKKKRGRPKGSKGTKKTGKKGRPKGKSKAGHCDLRTATKTINEARVLLAEAGVSLSGAKKRGKK